MRQLKAMIKYMGQIYEWAPWKVPEALIWNAFLNFKDFINLCRSHGLILWVGVLVYGFCSRALTPAIHGFRHTDYVV
jgi:hypothetical protein